MEHLFVFLATSVLYVVAEGLGYRRRNKDLLTEMDAAIFQADADGGELYFKGLGDGRIAVDVVFRSPIRIGNIVIPRRGSWTMNASSFDGTVALIQEERARGAVLAQRAAQSMGPS